MTVMVNENYKVNLRYFSMIRSYSKVWDKCGHFKNCVYRPFSAFLHFSHIRYSNMYGKNNNFTLKKTLKMITLNNEKLPVIKNHLTIVYCTVYRLIRSVTLIKSIGSAKPRKARVFNFKAWVKPKARALETTGLFSITTDILKS